MAHLIRPWQVRYIDKDGKRVPKETPGAKRVKERARKMVRRRNPWPRVRRQTLRQAPRPAASDKNVARQRLAELVLKAEARRGPSGRQGDGGGEDAVEGTPGGVRGVASVQPQRDHRQAGEAEPASASATC